MRSGDGPYRPTGSRLLWLEGFQLSEELWASLRIPIGLAFFMRSSSAGSGRRPLPEPGGRHRMRARALRMGGPLHGNPALESLDEDVEGLIVNRIRQPNQFAIAPIDECYRLVGAIKASWEGISGGDAVERVVPAFFEELRQRAAGMNASEGNGWAAGDGNGAEAHRGRATGAGAPGAELRGPRGPGPAALGRADPRLRPRGRRPLRSAGLHDLARGPDRDRAGPAPLRRGDPRAADRAPRRARPDRLTDEDDAVGTGRRPRPALPGTTTVAVPVPCNYDLEVAATNYFRSIADGEVPLVFHFNGSVYLPGPGRPAADRPDLLGGVDRVPDADRDLAGR